MRAKALLTVLCVAVATGCTTTPPGDRPLVLRGVTVIDGNGGSARTNVVVVIDSGKIVAVGSANEVRTPRHALVEDATGQFLMPGLIDVHAHALVPTCTVATDGTRSAGFDWALSERLMESLLRFGITTARSPSTPTALGVAMRDSIAAHRVVGPRLLVAGELINGKTRTPASVRTEVRAQATHGVDYIKLYSQLAPDAVRAGIEEAHALNMPVIGHLQQTTWSEALDANIDYLTHAAPWTDEMLNPAARERYRQAMASRGSLRSRIDWLEALDPAGAEVRAVVTKLAERRVPVDPTLVAFDTKFSYDSAYARPIGSQYRLNPNRNVVPGLVAMWEACGAPTDDWTADDFRRAKAAWPTLLALVKQYHDGGVVLAAGSDTPNAWVIPGESLHRELELLVDAGIPISQVLRIATRNGAEALGLLHETGTIEPGKRADLVMLSANPQSHIANTRRIVWVMRGGTRFYQPD